ncbi:MAG: response regulator [Deltaproteobacteria bacterium]|nr:response regulator [Deltaproteobacteria bacterium]
MTTRLRILLVDDDRVDREIVKRAFRSAGISAEIVEAEAAEPALAKVAAEPDGFDLGLFDLRLPGRDGLELLTDVRARGSEMPVIFLTGQGSEEMAVELMKSGAADYLAKGSLSPDRLQRSVGQVLRLAATERARRDAERALRDSEASFRRLAENLPDCIIRFDAEGRYAYVNAAVPWRASSDADAVLGMTLAEAGAVEPELVATLADGLESALQGTSGQVTIYVPERVLVESGEVPCADGDEPDDDDDDGDEVPRWLEVRFVPETASGAAQKSVLAIVRDVTAQVMRLEEEHRRAEFERQLIGIVSHDLRNPIGAMLMSVSLLTRKLDPKSDHTIERALDILQKSSQRARRMVSDILDFTKARLGGGIPMHPADIDLETVASEVVAETRAAHPERAVELVVEGSARGFFDGDRLAQAMSNLLVNAITYSAPTEVVEMRITDHRSEVCVAVTNRGETIPPDVLPRLFKPFQRGETKISDHGAGRSVGLGLFIVEQIVHGHRGRIEVHSEDRVTVFRMMIPRRSPSGRMRALQLPAAGA